MSVAPSIKPTVTYSLIGDKSGTSLVEAPVGSPDAKGNLIGGPVHGAIDPRLGPLAYNGGPTFLDGSKLLTRALLPGSPAIDTGNPAAVAGVGAVPLFDQRGSPFNRVADGDGAGGARIDIGAFELQSMGPALLGDYNQNGGVDSGDYVVWRKTLGTTGVPAFSGADGDGNGIIDQDDYTVWQTHFGESALALSAGSGVSGLKLNGPNFPVDAFSIATALKLDTAPSEGHIAATSAAGIAVPAVQSRRPDSDSKPAFRLMHRYRIATSRADDLILLALDRIESRPHEDHSVAGCTEPVKRRDDFEGLRQIDDPLAIALGEWQ
jgi:hypothetical protein